MRIVEWMHDLDGNLVAVVESEGKMYRLRHCKMRRDGELETFEGELVGDDEVLLA